jgi:hypothetical protein
MCGTLIVARQRLDRNGQYSALFLGGPTMLQVTSRNFEHLARLLTITSIVGSVLSYIFYWLAVIGVLLYMKYTEVSSATVL